MAKSRQEEEVEQSIQDEQAIALATKPGGKKEFADQIKAVKAGADRLFLFKCSDDKCKNIHFRHAGYVEALMPLIQADQKTRIAHHSHQVLVCTKCRKSYIWYDERMYDLSEQIDMNAWAKAEKELHKATGDGGQC